VFPLALSIRWDIHQDFSSRGEDVVARGARIISEEIMADEPTSGAIPFGAGLASVVRIPIPGTNGLAIELTPRGHVPPGGTTSTLFFQDPTGKRHLRLDYGYNVKSKTIDYHWNQKGTHANFGIQDHTTVGKGGQRFYQAMKAFRYFGRALLIVGVVVDGISIVQASKPMRRASQVVAGWAGAWAGCKVVGAAGAAGGTFIEPGGGTAVGGFAGCIIGGIGGYFIGQEVGGVVYDWAEDTFFTPLPEMPVPAEAVSGGGGWSSGGGASGSW
jgi:hypothetical protein